jgi:type I restriction enzyme S subunit
MTRADFFKHFELLTDQPNAVAKVCKLVLQLAVQGRLDTSSRSESVPKEKLGSIIELVSGQHLVPTEYNTERKGIPYLTGPADFGPRYPTPSRWTECPKVVAKKGDILLTVKGAGVGKTNVVQDEIMAISRQLMAVRSKIVDSGFLELSLRSAFDAFQAASNGIAIPGISREDVLNYEVWTPPLAEQRRIVAKVDELTALCDELAARQQAQHSARSQLQRSALHHLLTARDKQTSTLAWRRVRDNFTLLHDTPDAIPQLRQLILELAVRGKLVKQDLRDEPVSKLLERIKEEKNKQTGQKSKSQSEPLPSVNCDEVAFPAPNGWTWARTQQVTTYVQRGKSPKYSIEKKIPVIAQKCIQWSGFELHKALFIEPESLESYAEERMVRDGDLLWNSTGLGTLGRIIVFKERFKGDYPKIVADSHVTVIRPSKHIVPDFLFLWFAGPIVQNEVNSLASGSTKQTELATTTVLRYPIPLPPLAEQRRIVAKVDELMALCDELEQRQRETRKLGVQLLDSVVHHILDE